MRDRKTCASRTAFGVKIGFCRDELLNWCENNRVDYVLGFARNPRLRALVADALTQAHPAVGADRQPARVFVRCIEL